MEGYNSLNAVSKFYYLEFLFKFYPNIFVLHLTTNSDDHGDIQGICLQYRYPGLVRDICSKNDMLNFNIRLLPSPNDNFSKYYKSDLDNNQIIKMIAGFAINNQLYLIPYLFTRFKIHVSQYFIIFTNIIDNSNNRNYFKLYKWLIYHNYISIDQIIEFGLVNKITYRRVLLDIINSNSTKLQQINKICDYDIFVYFIHKLRMINNTKWSTNIIYQCIIRRFDIDIINDMLNSDSAWHMLHIITVNYYYDLNIDTKYIDLLLQHITKLDEKYTYSQSAIIKYNNLTIIQHLHKLGVEFNNIHLLDSLQICSYNVVYYLINNINIVNADNTDSLINKLINEGYLAPLKAILNLPRKYNFDKVNNSWTGHFNIVIQKGYKHMQQFIIDYCNKNSIIINFNQLLINSVNHNNYNSIIIILKQGADPNHNNAEALYRAKCNKNNEIVQLLIKHGASEIQASKHGPIKGYRNSNNNNHILPSTVNIPQLPK